MEQRDYVDITYKRQRIIITHRELMDLLETDKTLWAICLSRAKRAARGEDIFKRTEKKKLEKMNLAHEELDSEFLRRLDRDT